MTGSHALSTQNESCQALVVTSYPPALSLSQAIVASCDKVAVATCSSVFVMGRTANAVPLRRDKPEQSMEELIFKG